MNNNIPKNFWTTLVAVFILLIVFLAAASIKELKAIGYVGKSDATVNTITVNGTGDTVSKPDIATFSFSVSETGKTVAEAQTKATAKETAALKGIRAGGVEDKDIQTTSYTINPHLDYQEGVCTPGGICRSGKSVQNGYDVGESIEVKVRDLSKAGDLFGTIGAAGVQNVNGLLFSIDKPEVVKAQARSKAIADAKSKADELAKELGVSLIRITSFNESGNYPYQPMYATSKVMAQDAAQAPSPEIPAGEQKVTSNVTITYEIK